MPFIPAPRGAGEITKLSGGVLILFLQRRRANTNPQHKVIVKWFQQSILIGCAVFCFLVFLPPLLGGIPLVSQGFSFVVFLSIYISLAVGVAQYRLFDLDTWWFEIWIWLGAGVLLIGVDLLLATLLQQSVVQSSWAALALTGWIYFPCRQWVLGNLVTQKKARLEQHLPELVKEIASAQQPEELPLHWQRCLSTVFQPSRLQIIASPASPVNAAAFDGLKLECQLTTLSVSAVLEYTGHGKRLFNRADVQLARAISTLFDQAFISLQARTQAVNEERERIREDIHDSLGGHILAIMHQQSEPMSREFARSAWWELRDILSALDYRREPLALVLARWKQDLTGHIEAGGVSAQWHITLHEPGDQIEISGFKRLNLGQTLREIVTNGLHHSQPSYIGISISMENHPDTLQILLQHDNCSSDPAQWQAGLN